MLSAYGHLPSRIVPPADFEPANSFYLAGESAPMRRVRSQLERIAPYFRMALLTGEAGTGKETVARALHARSAGRQGPFVAWQATQFAERVLSESQGTALLAAAQGGTLCLQSVHALPLPLQQRLLRLLQQREQRSQRCELRIVATSEQSLRTLTTTGQFREDLYRQLAAVEIGLIPLRQRKEDLGELAGLLMRQTGYPSCSQSIAHEAIARLESYAWPGNIRELREVLEQATRLAEGSTMEPRHLPLPETVEPKPVASMERLQDVVQKHVLEVLTRCSGNKLRASEALGISRSTLYRMLDACTTGGSVGYPG